MSTNAAPVELWQRWSEIGDMVDVAGRRVTSIEEQWKRTTDRAVQDRLEGEFVAASREYRIVSAWQNVFYAAFIFATDGAECAALDARF